MTYPIGLVVVVPEPRNGLGGRAARKTVGLGDAKIDVRGTPRCLQDRASRERPGDGTYMWRDAWSTTLVFSFYPDHLQVPFPVVLLA